MLAAAGNIPCGIFKGEETLVFLGGNEIPSVALIPACTVYRADYGVPVGLG